MDSLPDEILLEIISYSPPYLPSVLQVCRRFYFIGTCDEIWKPHCRMDKGVKSLHIPGTYYLRSLVRQNYDSKVVHRMVSRMNYETVQDMKKEKEMDEKNLEDYRRIKDELKTEINTLRVRINFLENKLRNAESDYMLQPQKRQNIMDGKSGFFNT